MLLASVTSILLSMAVVFVACLVAMFLIYYFTSPLYTVYGDRRSRLCYCLVNALYFSLALAVLLAAVPALMGAYGMLAGLAVGLAIIGLSTLAHVYVISTLVRRGFIKISRKKRHVR